MLSPFSPASPLWIPVKPKRLLWYRERESFVSIQEVVVLGEEGPGENERKRMTIVPRPPKIVYAQLSSVSVTSSCRGGHT